MSVINFLVTDFIILFWTIFMAWYSWYSSFIWSTESLTICLLSEAKNVSMIWSRSAFAMSSLTMESLWLAVEVWDGLPWAKSSELKLTSSRDCLSSLIEDCLLLAIDPCLRLLIDLLLGVLCSSLRESSRLKYLSSSGFVDRGMTKSCLSLMLMGGHMSIIYLGVLSSSEPYLLDPRAFGVFYTCLGLKRSISFVAVIGRTYFAGNALD